MNEWIVTVAELADALDLESSVRKDVGVRLSPVTRNEARYENNKDCYTGKKPSGP